MGLFKKKERGDDGACANERDSKLPTTQFLNPTLKILEGFKEDQGSSDPIIRLAKHLREQFGVQRGDSVVLKKGDRMIKARVDVSSASDGDAPVARLNRASRELLCAGIGDEIEVIPRETLILLIDTSGSMADYISGIIKMEAAKNAVREFIRSKFLMQHGDRLGLISFGEWASIIEKPSENYEHLENRVDVLSPNGSTAMFEGMRMAIDNVSAAGGAKRIVLLTDGIPTTTGRMSIITLAREAAERHIVIDTVGVGSPFDFMAYDEPLLRKVAAITGGTFRRVLDIQQLTGQLRELAEGKNFTYLLPEK
jgi:uncharacterized protein YegL